MKTFFEIRSINSFSLFQISLPDIKVSFQSKYFKYFTSYKIWPFFILTGRENQNVGYVNYAKHDGKRK